MGYQEKINIYVPHEIGLQLRNDAKLFEIFKKDNRTVNLNRFLTLVLCGYYDDYCRENKEIHDSVMEIIGASSLSIKKQEEIADRIVNEVFLPNIPKRKGKKPIRLSLKPTNETERIIQTIMQSLQGKDFISQYFCRMLMSYCKKPISERERIVFKENYDKYDGFVICHGTDTLAYTAAALSYANAIKQVSDAIGTSYSDELLKLVIAQEGVLNVDKSYDAEKYWEHIAPVFNEVLAEFCESRAKEGAKLKVDLEKKLAVLDECASFFKEWQPKMEAKFKEQIIARFEELLGDRVDEQRVLTETAALMVRYTINEEIVRLHSHLDSLHREFENETPGKRIDFFCQEANREINTIGSKNQFKEVRAMVVNAKDALENIREQSKNVE